MWNKTVATPFLPITDKLAILLSILVCLYCSYIIFFTIDLSRSFWYDEAHVAWMVSGNSLWEIFAGTFTDGIGRPAGYLLISKLLSYFYNVELTYRIIQIFALYFCFYLAFLIGWKKKAYLLMLAIFSFVFLSDNFINHATEYKPYVFDVLALLYYAYVFIDFKFEKNTLRNILTIVFVSSILSLFSTWAWTGTVAVALVWISTLGSKLSVDYFKSEIATIIRGQYIIYFVGCALIWTYNLQRIARSFLGSDGAGESFYVYVASEGVKGEGFLSKLIGVLKKTWENIETFGVVHASDGLNLFLLQDKRHLIIATTLAILAILGLFNFKRAHLKRFVVFFILISIILSLLVSWPYDAERWSLGLFPAFLILAFLGLEFFKKINSAIPIFLVFALLCIQVPWKTHGNGINFHHSDYWRSRGQPATDSRELIAALSNLEDRTIDNFVLTRNFNVFFQYYTEYYHGAGYSELADTNKLFIPSSLPIPDEASMSLSEAKNFAYLHFHSFGNYENVTSTLSSICPMTDEIKDSLGNRRLIRAAFAYFECGESQLILSRQAIEKEYLSASEACPLDKGGVLGGKMYNFEEGIVLPQFLELRFDEGQGGINSDQINLANTELILETGENLDFTRFEVFLREEDSKRPIRFDTTYRNEKILLGDKVYDQGLGAHANAKIVFLVPKKYRGENANIKFSYGIDSRMESRGNAELSLCLKN